MDTTIIGTDYNSEKLSDLSKKFSTIQKIAKNHKVVYKNSTDNSLLNLINERKYRQIASAYRATKNGELLANLSPCEKALVSLLNKPFEWIDDLEIIDKDCVVAQNILTNSYSGQEACIDVESLDESAKKMEDFLTKEDDFLLKKEFFLEYKKILKLAIENEKLMMSLKKDICDQLAIRACLKDNGMYDSNDYCTRTKILRKYHTGFHSLNKTYDEEFCKLYDYDHLFEAYKKDNSILESRTNALHVFRAEYMTILPYSIYFEDDKRIALDKFNKLKNKIKHNRIKNTDYKDLKTLGITIEQKEEKEYEIIKDMVERNAKYNNIYKFYEPETKSATQSNENNLSENNQQNTTEQAVPSIPPRTSSNTEKTRQRREIFAARRNRAPMPPSTSHNTLVTPHTNPRFREGYGNNPMNVRITPNSTNHPGSNPHHQQGPGN